MRIGNMMRCNNNVELLHAHPFDFYILCGVALILGRGACIDVCIERESSVFLVLCGHPSLRMVTIHASFEESSIQLHSPLL